MNPGRFAWFAWNVGDPINFKVLQFDTNPHKHNMLVQRGDVVLRNLEATGYNSDLAPKSDAYLPEVHLEGGPPSKPSTPEHQGTVDPPKYFHTRGGEENGTSP